MRLPQWTFACEYPGCGPPPEVTRSGSMVTLWQKSPAAAPRPERRPCSGRHGHRHRLPETGTPRRDQRSRVLPAARLSGVRSAPLFVNAMRPGSTLTIPLGLVDHRAEGGRRACARLLERTRPVCSRQVCGGPLRNCKGAPLYWLKPMRLDQGHRQPQSWYRARSGSLPPSR